MQNLMFIGAVVGSTVVGVALGTVTTRLLLSATGWLVAAGRAQTTDPR